MKLGLKFKENAKRLDLGFGQYQGLTDGGYERGYGEGYAKGEIEGYNNGYEKGNADGYSNGHTEGYNTGYNDGLAKRTYEVWTITLTDNSIVEKEVALL